MKADGDEDLKKIDEMAKEKEHAVLLDLYDGDEGAVGSVEGRVERLVFERRINELNKKMTYMRPLERRNLLNKYCNGMQYS